MATQTLLKNSLWENKSSLTKVTLFLIGVFLLAFSSQLSIPIQPVPLTFQSATVILIGMAYGPRLGSYVIMAYYLAAIAGLPVLADMNSGLVHFYGPTGGYLLGFLPAAFLSGYLAQVGLGRTIVTSFVAALIGATVIFACGLGYLSHFVGFKNAVIVGLSPFVLTETIKLAAVSIVIPKLWRHSTN